MHKGSPAFRGGIRHEVAPAVGIMWSNLHDHVYNGPNQFYVFLEEVT